MMTTSKQIILSAIRRHHLAEAPLTNLDQAWITFADPRQQFVSVLESVGGRAVCVPDVAGLNSELAAMPAWTEARKVVSLVEGVETPPSGRGIDLGQIDDP